jgi:hypothetical protein
MYIWLTEEQMLHEEVDLKWEELQAWVQDFQLLERLRADLVVGVSINRIKLDTVSCECYSLHMKSCIFYEL